MKNLAIIPARGGSKRIPRKNVKYFSGKPVIAYPIEAAVKSGLFDEIMVSTDDKEIAGIAQQYGAKVPFMRSDETANDYAGLTDVLLEVLEAYHMRGSLFDYCCCILPTSPLLDVLQLSEAYQYLMERNFDSVYPVVPFSYPVLRSVRLDQEGEIKMQWPEYSNTRSQDLEPLYHDAGSFYWVNTAKFMHDRTFDTLKCGGIVTDEMRVQDIDNETDWKLAELKFNMIHNIE